MTLARGLRSGNLFSKRNAVLDAPSQTRVSERTIGFGEDSADSMEDEGEFAGRVRRPGVRLVLPKTRWGRVGAACGLVLLTGSGVAGLVAARSFVLHDEHFVVDGPGAIRIEGNSHLTRPQLLSVFGGDVERNVFNIPLSERREELERLPWVAHATVMRLLPNQVRVAIVERTPVAFVRQGHEIGLVDASGVLLDMAGAGDGVADSGQGKEPVYSFPVLTGISAEEPLSTRAARMRIYAGFVAALDATGENVSRKLSEVDVSNPEDVRAIFAESAGANGAASNADVLVHFGDERYLERYKQYRQHLAEWKTQYPHLGSVDMRYERQVVLEMPPGTNVNAEPNGVHPTHGDKAAVDGAPGVLGGLHGPDVGSHPVHGEKAALDGAPARSPAVRDVGKKPVAKAAVAKSSSQAPAPGHHLMTSFDVGTKAAGAQGSGAAKPAGSVKDPGQEGPR